MKLYLQLLENILQKGHPKTDRTKTGTVSTFGQQLRFNLQEGFPILTTKKIHFKSIVGELLWFLKGHTNIHSLHENKISIWDEWAAEDGSLGPMYGEQWRSWPTNDGESVDQISNLIHSIQTNPHSRRHIVSALNISYVPYADFSPQENVAHGKMALWPCHCFFQFYIHNDKYLNCLFYMRSSDTFLGLPFNIASYALLTHIIANHTDLLVGELIWIGGDVHIYQNHIEQVQEQLLRTPYPLPKLLIREGINNFFEYEIEDFSLENYQSHPRIKAPIAI